MGDDKTEKGSGPGSPVSEKSVQARDLLPTREQWWMLTMTVCLAVGVLYQMTDLLLFVIGVILLKIWSDREL